MATDAECFRRIRQGSEGGSDALSSLRRSRNLAPDSVCSGGKAAHFLYSPHRSSDGDGRISRKWQFPLWPSSTPSPTRSVPPPPIICPHSTLMPSPQSNPFDPSIHSQRERRGPRSVRTDTQNQNPKRSGELTGCAFETLCPPLFSP